MVELACIRMRCSSFVGNEERQLWRSWGADVLKFSARRLRPGTRERGSVAMTTVT
jgi:hypothetical protein